VPDPTALFWDVGGVLLSNGWDRATRRRTAEEFGLAWEEFEDRHELVVPAFEKGQLGLDAYLEQTVFYQPRSFPKQRFIDWMLAQSTPNSGTLAVVDRLARTGKYLLATLNNESLELNEYRVSHFGLRNYFTLFLSSCYLGVRKPDEAIYRLALQLTQRPAGESIFIDDRALNVECARRCRMNGIQFQDPAQLERELRGLGVEF
jgi:putative hydrolase of the HAD superfamily